MSVHPLSAKDAQLRKRRPVRLMPSSASSRNGNGNSGPSILLWKRKPLGDKLQWLAAHQPKHLRSLERLVDQIIRYIKAHPARRSAADRSRPVPLP